jgi:folate-binding protein YgfZ
MWPIMGVDISTDMIPAETGIVECAVSFTKGCYPGQELVERMDSRGSTAPKMLMRIECPADAVVGSDVVVNGVTVGTYTTVEGAQAIALIKRGTVLS